MFLFNVYTCDSKKKKKRARIKPTWSIKISQNRDGNDQKGLESQLLNYLTITTSNGTCIVGVFNDESWIFSFLIIITKKQIGKTSRVPATNSGEFVEKTEKKGNDFVLNIQLKNELIATFLLDLIDKLCNLYITTIVIEFNLFVFDRGWHTLLVLLLLLFVALFIFEQTSYGAPVTRQAGDESRRRERESVCGGGLERAVYEEEREIKDEFEAATRCENMIVIGCLFEEMYVFFCFFFFVFFLFVLLVFVMLEKQLEFVVHLAVVLVLVLVLMIEIIVIVVLFVFFVLFLIVFV